MTLFLTDGYSTNFWSHGIVMNLSLRKLEGFFEILREDSGIEFESISRVEIVDWIQHIQSLIDEQYLPYLLESFYPNHEVPRDKRQSEWNTRYSRFPMFKFCKVNPKLLMEFN